MSSFQSVEKTDRFLFSPKISIGEPVQGGSDFEAVRIRFFPLEFLDVKLRYLQSSQKVPNVLG